MRHVALVTLILLISTTAMGEPCVGSDVCVPKQDLDTFVSVLHEKKCLQTQKPSIELDSITVTTDDQGRVFYSGADPSRPYRIYLRWCGYEIVGTGSVKVVAALKEPSTLGFRFRPKAYLGYLPAEPLFHNKSGTEGIDAGLMLDFFHWQLANVNAAVGFRSFGLGFGADITANFGAYLGYAMTWKDWNHNLNTAFWFAF